MKLTTGMLTDESDTLNYLSNELAKNIARSQEGILKNIVSKITGRPATIEDAKDLIRVYYPGELLNYSILYKRTIIGKMVFELSGNSYSVTFIPTVNN